MPHFFPSWIENLKPANEPVFQKRTRKGASRRASYRNKSVRGYVEAYNQRTTPNGSIAHEYTIKGTVYTLFNDTTESLLAPGDHVSFEAKERRRQSGRRTTYYSVDDDSIQLLQENGASKDEDGGYVYILTNKSLAGLRKIGFTRGSPDKRAKELSGVSGVPTPFIVEFSQYVDCDPQTIESSVHALLSYARREKEFFRIGPDEAREAINEVYASKFPERAEAQGVAITERRRTFEEKRAVELERREQERREREWLESDEYKWQSDGKLAIHLKTLRVDPSPSPGLFARLFKAPVHNWARIQIDGNKNGNWTVSINGVADNHDLYKRCDFASYQSATSFVLETCDKITFVSVSINFEIDCLLLEELSLIEPHRSSHIVKGDRGKPTLYTPTLSRFGLKNEPSVDFVQVERSLKKIDSFRA